MRAWPAIEVVVRDAAAERLQAALHDHAVAAVSEEGETWRIVFHDQPGRNRALDSLKHQFPRLAFELLEIPDEDWAARSQAALGPVAVGRLLVTPPWHRPGAPLEADSCVIVILPSMGFGTGHHATTRLCLGALQQVEVAGRSVLDVGTGSGVLALAASAIGAARVVAVDDDPDAIQSAAENARLNPSAPIDLRRGDIRTLPLDPADLILANLTGALLVRTAARLAALLTPSGTLILSGLLAAEEADVRAAFAALEERHRQEEDGWVCLRLEARRATARSSA
jgi:ribosomal protein L11 methyltransferase